MRRRSRLNTWELEVRAGDETGLLESALLKGSLNVKALREVLDRLLENLSDSSSSPFFPLFFFF